MIKQLTLDDICYNRHKGNPNSVKANQIAKKYKLGARQRIIECLENHEMTCEELEAFTGLSHQTCSARCSDLKRDGRIIETGKRLTRSGSPASVYKAVR